MYLPFLRGKQFELEALLEVSPSVYGNTLPIIEPVNIPRIKFYEKLTNQQVPFILITNPYHPISDRLSNLLIQNLIDTDLAAHSNLTLGHIVDVRYNLVDLLLFLNSNPSRDKALIFRYNPLPSDITAISSAIGGSNVSYLIFDYGKTNNITQTAFGGQSMKILLKDGFQRQDKNSDYPTISTFDSDYNTWSSHGWDGIGDYSIIGDYFSQGGGQVFVVTLHVSKVTNSMVEVHHFSSTFNATLRGFPAQKFAEANDLLVNSTSIIPLSSSGLDIYRDLHLRAHNPQLGVGKKASTMHHIELLSSII